MKTKRPDDLPYPYVWSEFSRTTPKGEKLKFKIQDCPDEMLEDVLVFMCEYFMKDETLNNAVGIQYDNLAIEEFRAFQGALFSDKLVLICIRDDGLEYDMKCTKPEILGFSLTYVSKKGEKLMGEFEPKSNAIVNLFKVLKEVESKSHATYEMFGVEEFLDDAGLSVHPSFRNLGIGMELLMSRFSIAKKLGLKVIEATFSSETSQAVAMKSGFKPMASISYDELSRKYDIDFKTTTKYLIIMTYCL